MSNRANVPDLLFVHGAHVGAWVWQEHFIPFFEARGHHCTALELRSAPDGGEAGREGLADYAARVTAALESAPTPPVVVAHSMGAAVSLRALTGAAGSSRAAGLVMLAPVPPFGLGAALPWLSVSEPVLWSSVSVLEAAGTDMPPAGVLENALFASDLPRERRLAYLERARPESRRALSELMTPFLAGWPVTPFAVVPGWQPWLGGAPACPMAVVGGGGDRLFGPALVKTSAAWLNAPCEIVPRMGHLLMLESDWERAAMATVNAIATTVAATPAAA